ncbi:hypothetical protein [Methylobacterium sp. ID0610]|uniref:hypothetical protein n=1 Tax=Methylobacterium carpenticola TaxID=3344827 RepID=UPI0036CEA291
MAAEKDGRGEKRRDEPPRRGRHEFPHGNFLSGAAVIVAWRRCHQCSKPVRDNKRSAGALGDEPRHAAQAMQIFDGSPACRPGGGPSRAQARCGAFMPGGVACGRVPVRERFRPKRIPARRKEARSIEG